jgi:hypothetical protein
MVTTEDILDLLNARKCRVLMLAQAALPETQFQAFRTLFLNEFGKSGFERELARLFQAQERTG